MTEHAAVQTLVWFSESTQTETGEAARIVLGLLKRKDLYMKEISEGIGKIDQTLSRAGFNA